MSAFWAAVGYGIAKGALDAYLEHLRLLEKAVEEAPNDADRARARRFRDAVLRLRRSEDGDT